MAVIKVFPRPVSHSYMFLSLPSASVFKAQISFLPGNPQPQKDPTHPELRISVDMPPGFCGQESPAVAARPRLCCSHSALCTRTGLTCA